MFGATSRHRRGHGLAQLDVEAAEGRREAYDRVVGVGGAGRRGRRAVRRRGRRLETRGASHDFVPTGRARIIAVRLSRRVPVLQRCRLPAHRRIEDAHRLHRGSRSDAAREARRRTCDGSCRGTARRRPAGRRRAGEARPGGGRTRWSAAASRRWASSRSTSRARRGSRRGCPLEVAATTVDSQCGSSQQAIDARRRPGRLRPRGRRALVRRRDDEPDSARRELRGQERSAGRCRRATSRATRSRVSSRARR